MHFTSDFLVVGSGLAGLWFALKAARHGSVIVLTKKQCGESNTNYAQGGIAVVMSPEDSFESHIDDTIHAGAGLCDPAAVDFFVRRGPEMVRELIALGVKFTTRRGEAEEATGIEFDLGREGGHSKRRVMHSSDFTGREVIRVVSEAVANEPNITLLENHIAIDLITSRKLGLKGGNRCIGAYAMEIEREMIHTFVAKATLLATGGTGKVYLYTSNPDVASGDGIAMAYRAGAATANMEFMQFHPTCLYNPDAKNFLISEAARGEGGILRLGDGTAFMERYHPRRELAPRDIVARAIDTEMKRTGDDHVLLDLTHLSAGFVKGRFPNIHERCLSYGLDITTAPIPVVPAAHYMCGGVKSDVFGRTTLSGLFVAGEAACTGLHGANRLASNSLLEALVMGQSACEAAAAYMAEGAGEMPIPAWDSGAAVSSDESVVITQNWDEIRRFMWNYVGIVRSGRRLERARRRIELLKDEIREYYWNFIVTADLVELRNIATVAELIVRCASVRKESRGLHFNIDHPFSNDEDWRRDTVIQSDSAA